jgi:ribonucleotide reductase alpha subunit
MPHRYFDFEKLREVASAAARNLNKIIDVNYYPAETARRSNLRHRPVGIGVQVRNYRAVFSHVISTT